MSKLTAKQAVARALSQVGMKENPAGSNLTVYGRLYGMNGVAWCAIFIWYVVNYSFTAILPKTAYTPTLETWARRKGILKPAGSAAKLGDLVLFQMPGPDRVNHVGMVIKDRAPGQPLYCVEGNTGGSDPRNGGMVAATKRTQYIAYIIDMSAQYAPELVKVSTGGALDVKIDCAWCVVSSGNPNNLHTAFDIATKRGLWKQELTPGSLWIHVRQGDAAEGLYNELLSYAAFKGNITLSPTYAGSFKDIRQH